MQCGCAPECSPTEGVAIIGRLPVFHLSRRARASRMASDCRRPRERMRVYRQRWSARCQRLRGRPLPS